MFGSTMHYAASNNSRLIAIAPLPRANIIYSARAARVSALFSACSYYLHMRSNHTALHHTDNALTYTNKKESEKLRAAKRLHLDEE